MVFFTPICIRATFLWPTTKRHNLGKYIALDFGIVGTLTDSRQELSGAEFSGFLSAVTTSAWRWRTSKPAGRRPDTRVDEFEAAIRAVCEPIFDRPMQRNFLRARTAAPVPDFAPLQRRESSRSSFMLQKTLLNIEGLGRQLDPNLDLWKTAKPFLERWMSEQLGLARASSRNLKNEAPNWARIVPQFPRLVHQALTREPAADLAPIALCQTGQAPSASRTFWLGVIAAVAGGLACCRLLQINVHRLGAAKVTPRRLEFWRIMPFSERSAVAVDSLSCAPSA